MDVPAIGIVKYLEDGTVFIAQLNWITREATLVFGYEYVAVTFAIAAFLSPVALISKIIAFVLAGCFRLISLNSI